MFLCIEVSTIFIKKFNFEINLLSVNFSICLVKTLFTVFLIRRILLQFDFLCHSAFRKINREVHIFNKLNYT